MNSKQVEDQAYQVMEKMPSFLYYHNKQHTENVVTAACLLCKNEDMSVEETQLIITAALLHDTGFLRFPDGKHHEEESCRVAKQILSEAGYLAAQIDVVCRLIMATKMPQSPASHCERILCDADLYYLGTPDFFTISHSLFRELSAQQKIISINDWQQQQIRFLSSHRYFTKTAQQQLEATKQSHLQTIVHAQQTTL